MKNTFTIISINNFRKLILSFLFAVAVIISGNAQVDMSPVSLTAPVPNQCYTANETVTVRVRNFGSLPIDFNVNPMTVNCWSTNTNPQTFPPVIINSGILAVSATQDVVITNAYDMTTLGMYTFTASTVVAADGNAANDSLVPVNIDGNILAGTASILPSNDSICFGDTATLILAGYTGGIQWQSFDGIGWNNETGAGNNTASYQVSPLVTTTYRAVVCGTAISNSVTLNVIIVAPPTTVGDTRCGYGTVNLSASGVGNFNWYTNPTGGSPLFTGPVYSPTVAVTTTYYVESVLGSANTSPLTTTFAAGNGQSGNMFDITALNSVTITHFDAHVGTGTHTFEVWYRPGTYFGFQNDSTTWTHLGTATGVVAAGAGNPTPVPIFFAVNIPAGQTYGFYVTSRTGTVSYTNGTAINNVYAQDANIQFREGHGGTYFALTFSPRVFNGNIYYESGCASATRTSVTATVTFADTISVTASQTLICGAPGSTTITLNATSANAGYNYTWTGADLISTTGPVVTATPNATTTYVVTGDDGTCADTTSITIILSIPPVAAATAAPSNICMGQPSQLSTPPGPVTYSVSSIAYAPLTFTGTSGPTGDNVLSGIQPIGFTFNFFGNNYTNINISTNGNIQFGPTFSTSGVPAVIPTATGLNNYIGAPWANLSTIVGGNITRATLGVAPNRLLVVSYNNMGFNTGGGFENCQIVLYEGSNCIEVHAGTVSNTTLNKVIGIENQNGTAGYTAPGRNSSNWNLAAPEAWSFCPVSPYTFAWTPVTWLNNPAIFNPALTPLSTGSFNYDVIVTDQYGCTSTSSVTVNVTAVPSAPTSSNLTRCGVGTVTMTATAGGPGMLQWFTQPVGGTPFATGSPVTSPVISATTTFYVEEFDGSCPGPRTPVVVTVTQPDTVSVSASQTVICGQPSATIITLNASSNNASYIYTWTGADLISTTGPTVTANPSDTITYVVTGDDGTCADTASITIILIIPPTAVAAAAPVSVCLGQTSQLSTPQGPITYSVNPIAYSPVVFTGNAGPVGDNVLSGVQPIGFTFNFFGNNYTSFNISTNGNIQFGPTFSTSGVPALIPTAAAPNNYIGLPWGNLSTIIGGNITWATLGTAPNQMLVVSYNNMGFNTGGGFLDGQIILYEGTNCMEMHVGTVSNTTLNKALGIENQTGTLGYAAPGRNSGNWNLAAPEAWSFCPVSPYTFVWSPVTWLDNPAIINPVLTPATTGSFTYNVTVTDINSGCTSTSSVSVTALTIPAAPTTVGDTRCGYGVVNLSASGTGNLNWYTTPTGGSPIFTGPNYSPMVGSTTTYYVESTVGSASSGPVTTTFAAGNGQSGNMFDITALGNVTITHFDGHIQTGTHTIKVWYRPGSYVGFQTDSSTWTLLGTATGVVAAGAGLPTPIPIIFAVPIPPGQTYGFYVTSTTGTISYTNGTAVGNVYAQDANIQVREGHGGTYFNLTFSPRVFNGNVYYESGCPSASRTSVTATVTPADTIIATTTANPMCSGNPVTISISSANSSYIYTWSPATGLSDTTGSTVTANPLVTTLYTINALDTAACATSTTVNLVVNPSPVITATANPVTVCAGTPLQLNVNNFSAPIEYTVGTGTTFNTPTGYPAPYGNFYWGARHQMLITQAELLAAGLTAGDIYSLAFDVENVNSCPPLVNFEIKMMNTTAVNMTAWLTGLTSVYTNPLYTPAVGWNTHTFATPFTWDGISNIVVETCFNNSSFLANGNCSMRRTTTPFTSSRYYRADLAGVCSNTTSTTGTSTFRPNMRFGIPSSFNYLWTPNTTLSNDTIVNPVATPTAQTTYTVSVSDNYWNCTSTASVTVNVNPLPVVTQSPLNSICIDAAPLSLAGGTPAGGNYSGTGVSNNIFYASVAGVGTHTITYNYTDNLGCTGMDSTTIVVNDLPVVTMPTFPTFCSSGAPVTLSTGVPSGGTYSGTGVNAGMFDPTAAGTGIHGITYTYTDTNGCTNSVLRNIIVNDAPVANAGPDALGNTTLNGSASGGTPPYTYVWNPCFDLSNCTILNPLATPTVNTNYVLTVIDANGCYSSDTVYVVSTVGIGSVPGGSIEFLVYPNPNSGLFNVIFIHPNDKAEVSVTDIIGQEVFSSGIITAPATPYAVDIATQPDGVYVLRVKYKERTFVSRLVLSK